MRSEPEQSETQEQNSLELAELKLKRSKIERELEIFSLLSKVNRDLTTLTDLFIKYVNG